MTNWIAQKQREAADKVRVELAKPVSAHEHDIGDEYFDPWELFPSLYGSYSRDFDDMALLVLRNLNLAYERRWDDQDHSEGLAHEMFREMLCTADLCDYGTSPRVCFATEEFGSVLPDLIAKWEAYALVHWGAEA
jgi:hypothetical protein